MTQPKQTAICNELTKAYGVAVKTFADKDKAAITAFDECVNAAYSALENVKDFAEFKLVRAGMVKACIDSGLDEKYSENKVSRHISEAKSKLDLVIPTEAASKAKAEKRAKTLEKTLTAAMVSGIGAEEAQKKIDRLAKSDDAKDKAIAKAVTAASQAAKQAREALKKAEEEKANILAAHVTLAKHYGVKVEAVQKALESIAKRRAA